MTNEHFAGAEGVAVRASCRRVDDPLPGRGLYQLAQHDYKPIPPKRAKLAPATCRILGSALAAWVSRGKGHPCYLACRVFTGLG